MEQARQKSGGEETRAHEETKGAGAPSTGSVPFERVLWDELRHLGHRSNEEPLPELGEIFRRLGRRGRGKGLSALCFSGGGIRSATFNLGVIQALAKAGLLGRFDYLSSVSGGGYIAGWLKAWLHRVPLAEVGRDLTAPAERTSFDPLMPEPEPLTHLREYSNYLTPRLGLFSADTWTAAALVVRNLLLNWLVLLPVLAAFIGIPQAGLIVASGATESSSWARGGLTVALALALWTSTVVYHFRRQRLAPPNERRIVLWAILPLWFSCLALALSSLWLPAEIPAGRLLLFCLVWCVAIPLLGWLLARVTVRQSSDAEPALADLLGLLISGGVAALILQGIALSWRPWLRAQPVWFVLLAVPILLGLYLLARAFFVAFASLGEREEPTPAGVTPHAEVGHASREWWARLSGWVLVLAVGWIVITALVVLGGFVLRKITGGLAGLGGMGLASAALTAYLGSSQKTSGARADRVPAQPSRLKELALRLVAPLTAAFIVVGLARFNAFAAQKVIEDVLEIDLKEFFELFRVADVPSLQVEGTLLKVFVTFVLVLCGLAGLSWLLGWVVDINRFSAQGLYRNRLMRAYLGASNLKRKPDPFTGFDPDDNIRLYELVKGATPRPLSVINVTLNLVGSADRLAWQQRMAESFSMTPLYCGSYQEGYRRSEEYGGSDGISLGTAITISGAAANPSSGYHSSPFISFLLTLFNVRLGSWLGNTNDHGEEVFRRGGPRHAWKALFADLLGLTDRQHAYVSLSDGGHFENLGVYEMILRRCRFIVASDAGQDGEHNFEDLGGLVRKVRTDFGIPIEFGEEIRILPRTAQGRGLLCALGTIHYECVDGKVDGRDVQPGLLLYLKPTLLAEGLPLPSDVLSYSRASDAFPHEPTSDQWFTEAQFESYRALGYHLASQLGGGGPFEDIPSLFEAVGHSLEGAKGSGRTREEEIEGGR